MELDTFSRSVKEELARVPVDGHSAAYWEAVALRRFLPARPKDAEGTFSTEPFVLRRLFYLMKQGSGVRPTMFGASPGRRYQARGHLPPPLIGENPDSSAAEAVKGNPTLRRAFLRGVFLARGSVSSPVRTHHLEMALPARKDAVFVRSLLVNEELGGGLVKRRSNWVVYLKDGDEISDLLSALGANKTVLDYENVRAQKSLKISVQRLVNMDRANVGRSVEAALRQLDDIRVIDEEKGLKSLPPALRELARLRVDNPDMSMEELGQALSTPASKSAVNHRFRRISEIAREMRSGRP